MTTYWRDQDDPTDTGVDVDPDYVGGEWDDDPEPAVGYDRSESEHDTLDSRSYKAATDGGESTELDANPLESAWANRGVQRTTFYADGTDGYGNELPQTALDGTDLGARRKRLWGFNSGQRHTDRSDVGRVDTERRETREMTEAVASQCPITDAERRRAVQIALDADGRRYNWCGGRPAMALAAVAQAVGDQGEAESRLLGTAWAETVESSTRTDPQRLIEFAFEVADSRSESASRQRTERVGDSEGDGDD